MVTFFERLFGALALDASIFENVEADPRAGMEAVVVVLAVCVSGGIGAMGLGLVGVTGFITGAIVVLGAWLVWVAILSTVGTIALAEPETHSDARELLRVLGYAAAPGVFLALAAIRPAAPFVLALVALWMIAAAVVAVRQALDYHSTTRAALVCAISWALSFGMMAALAVVFTTTVN
jgi:hypothetical protein